MASYKSANAEVFWRPGTIAPGSGAEIVEDEQDASILMAATSSQSRRHLTIDQFRKTLPVYQHRREFLYALSTHQVVIVCGQTGSGKTTQLPQYVYEVGYPGMIACTQPRRVAAISVATRVAEELEGDVGGVVGYAVRFEDKSSELTRIKYLTDGMLFREAMFDPLLLRYSVIMIDEAHERSLYTDLLLGLLKKISRKRKDLRLVISSATMDAEAFKSFFALAVDIPLILSVQGRTYPVDIPLILSVQGRTYPVDIFYLEEDPIEIVEETVSTIIKIHTTEPGGDILVFLPGKDEIDRCISHLSAEFSDALSPKNELIISLPLHAALPLELQMQSFEAAPPGRRKVIVATNIAETSVTINGIVYVVDSGKVKQKIFNPQTGLQVLLTTPISQASAQQRAGRAGRVAAGKAYRLYTEESFVGFPRNSIPEIQKCDLSTVVLQLKALGIDNVLNFDFMSPPIAECMARSVEFLYAFHALDDSGRLTGEVGVPMSELPLDPMLSRMLLASGEFGCGAEALTLAAMICAQPVFVNVPSGQRRALEEAKRKMSVSEGDLVSLVNIFRLFEHNGRSSAWCKRHFISFKAISKAAGIRSLLVKYMERYGLRPHQHTANVVSLLKCIATGFFAHAALAQPDGSYRSIRDGTTLFIHPNSVLFKRVPDCVLFYEVMETSKIFMRDVTVVDPEWLAEIAPNYYEFRRAKR